MSMQNWCTHGYGFRFDDHKDDLTLEGIQRLLERMKKDGCPMKEAYASYFRKMGIIDPQVEDYEETAGLISGTYNRTFCETLATALENRLDLPVSCEWDEDNGYYCLLLPMFIWTVKDDTPRMTQEEVDKVFNEYATLLFGHNVDLAYHDTSYFG